MPIWIPGYEQAPITVGSDPDYAYGRYNPGLCRSAADANWTPEGSYQSFLIPQILHGTRTVRKSAGAGAPANDLRSIVVRKAALSKG